MTDSMPCLADVRLELVVAQGSRQGNAIPVKGTQFLIGRGPECQLRAKGTSIGEQHCAILAREGRFFICDLNSATGTYLNDRQIFGEIELLNRDQLRIGQLQFQVALRTNSPVSSEPAAASSPSAEG